MGDLGEDALGFGHVGGGVGGTELEGPLPLVGDRIQREDVACAGDLRALHRVDPQAADPHHDDGLTVLGAAGAYRRAVAGGHPAADQRSLVQRNVFVDLYHRSDRYHGVFRKCSQDTHLADVMATAMEPEGAVELRSGHDGRAIVTEVAHPAGAGPAAPTRRNEAEYHVIARRDLGHQVVIGVAQSAGGQLHQHFPLPGAIEFEFLDLPFLVQTPQDSGFGLHRC